MEIEESTDNVSVGILCGGASLRFGGQDKAWLRHLSKPLIQWTLECVAHQGSEILISANRHQDRYAAMPARVVGDDCEESFAGPFAGMVRLLEQARGPWLLCVPCDAVVVPADLAASLLEMIRADQADLAVLSDANGIHPTFCLLPTRLAAEARKAFDGGIRAPRQWFAQFKVARLMGPAPLNINTPEALSALKLVL